MAVVNGAGYIELGLAHYKHGKEWWSRPLPQTQFAGRFQTRFETIKGLWRRASLQGHEKVGLYTL
ncbi:hypothetical protein VFPFJ_11251 [Purpureocillium lilacinum]|uniref:Uncharacterized protein n=1 Tax=Purpureocillium lilacinum TaxID=33203 RepID=A0A179FJ98_PURLI|nr:hypothetical protein VFPFJ_11251 [Purpureocillium lilacinum]OAQ65594.1 hypothetical protein VFPFJ_11251 [Purpureocillium lilacinum]